MTDVRDVALLLSQQRTTKQDRDPIYRGEIVEMRNNAGADSIHVDNRPLFVWVRLWSGQGSVVPCYNERVAAVNALPVWVSRRPGSINELEIIGLDVEILQSQANPNIGLAIPLHSASHEWPDAGPGIDPITVYPRSWSQLKVYPQNPLSTSVDVSPLRHQAGSVLVMFNGGTVALAGAIGPLAANEARLVLIYLDTSTNTLATINGAIGTIADGWTLAEPTIPADDAYLSAVVRIYNGQTTIDEFDIRDRRFFLNPVPGTISNVNWCNVWVVAACGGDFTTIVAAVADARVVNGDVLLIQPGTYAGFTTAKDLSFASLTPYNYANNTADVTVNTATTFSDAGGGQIVTLYGIEFTATVTVDYDPMIYALSCEFTGDPSVQDGANSSPGFAVFDLCYFWATDCVDFTNGTGLDVDFRVCHVAGNINVGANTCIMWSHYQPLGTVTAGTITRDDAPHIETASFGPDTLVVGLQGAQYATVAAAIAAPPAAGDLVWVQNGAWTSDDEDVPASTRLQGQDKFGCVLSTATAATVITLQDDTYISDVYLDNTDNDVANRAALKFEVTTSHAEAQNIIAVCDNDTAAGFGIWVSGNDAIVWLKECDGFSIGTSAPVYGLYVDGADDVVYVRGGYYYGITADICVNHADATIILIGPVLANGTITVTAGTVTGFWWDASGNFHTAPSGGDLDLEGVGRIDFDADNDLSLRATADDILTVEVGGADLFTMDAEGIKAPTRIMEMIWPDFPIQQGTLVEHFRQNAVAVPTGWTETDAASLCSTALYYSMWYLRGNAADASYDYRKQTGVDIEVDMPAGYFASFQFGPIFFRDARASFTGDVNYWFSIHGETAAAIDLTEFNRVQLQWSNAGGIWRIRGESDNGAGATTSSAWQNLDLNPIHQPIYVRVVIRNDAGVKTCRSYWGAAVFPETQTLFQSVGENTTWGDVFWRIHQTRPVAGVEDYLLVGAVDFWYNKA